MIPDNFYKYKEMPIWINDTIPDAILSMHETKPWVYGSINIISGELEYTTYKDDGTIDFTTILTPSNHGIVYPQQWHKIKPLWTVKMFIEFYKQKPDYITDKETIFKEKYDKSPHQEVQELVKLMESNSWNKALDIGCGWGRNSIFLADNGFCVDAIDRNTEALKSIQKITLENKLSISPWEVDLNNYSITGKCNCIFSTVVLQFLEPQATKGIISSMQSATLIWGYNLIIIPIDSDDHLCPIRFPTLFKSWEIKELYKDWDIIQYNEMLWKFHRTDDLWNKIISRFATIIARKK